MVLYSTHINIKLLFLEAIISICNYRLLVQHNWDIRMDQKQVAQHWKYTKNYWTIHFKMVTLVLCGLYLNNSMIKKLGQSKLNGFLSKDFITLSKLMLSDLKFRFTLDCLGWPEQSQVLPAVWVSHSPNQLNLHNKLHDYSPNYVCSISKNRIEFLKDIWPLLWFFRMYLKKHCIRWQNKDAKSRKCIINNE